MTDAVTAVCSTETTDNLMKVCQEQERFKTTTGVVTAVLRKNNRQSHEALTYEDGFKTMTDAVRAVLSRNNEQSHKALMCEDRFKTMTDAVRAVRFHKALVQKDWFQTMTDAVTSVCFAETADDLTHQSRQVLAMKQHAELVTRPTKISHNIKKMQREEGFFIFYLQHSWAQKGQVMIWLAEGASSFLMRRGCRGDLEPGGQVKIQ